MAFPLTCEACKKSFSIPDEVYERRVAGRVVTIKCKSCRTPIRVDGTANPPIVGGDATDKPATDVSLSPRVPTGPTKPTGFGAAKERAPAAIPAFRPKAAAQPFRSGEKPAPAGSDAAKERAPAAAFRPGASATTAAARTTATTATKPVAVSAALRPATASVSSSSARAPLKAPAPAPATTAKPAVAPVPTEFSRTSPESPAARKPSQPEPLLPEFPEEQAPAPSAEETLWAVDFGDEDDRELTEAGVLEELSRGTITAETLVWTEGMDDWQPLGQVPELAPLVTTAAREVPWAHAVVPGRHEEAIAALESIEPEPPSAEPVTSAELLPPSTAASASEPSRPALRAPLPPFPAAPFPASPEPEPTPSPATPVAQAQILFPPAPSAPKAPPAVETTPFGIPPVTNAGLAGTTAKPPLGLPVPGSPAALAEIPDFGARKKRGVWLVVGAAALLVVGAAVFLFARPSAEQTLPPAPAREATSVNPSGESPTNTAASEAEPAERDPTDSPAEPTTAARGAELEPAPSDFAEMFERAAKSSGESSGFDEKVAKEALSSVAPRTHRCRQPGEPAGVANVVVQFAPSGRVKNARVDGPPLEHTATAACIADAMRMARIPAFSGAGGQVVYPITIR